MDIIAHFSFFFGDAFIAFIIYTIIMYGCIGGLILLAHLEHS